MNLKKLDLLVILACAVSIAGLAVVVYPRLPETVPTHWNFRSEVDAYGPRWTILLMGLLPFAVFLLMKLAPRFDPRREAYERHAKPYAILTAVISLAFVPIAWIVALAALGVGIDVGILIRVVIGLLFIAIGNYLGTLRPNYFVGIRTPWTLADPEVWRRTHRRGALVFIAMGAVVLLSLALPHSALAGGLALASILLLVLYLFVYSYLEFRKRKKQG